MENKTKPYKVTDVFSAQVDNSKTGWSFITTPVNKNNKSSDNKSSEVEKTNDK